MFEVIEWRARDRNLLTIILRSLCLISYKMKVKMSRTYKNNITSTLGDSPKFTYYDFFFVILWKRKKEKHNFCTFNYIKNVYIS